MGADMIRRNPAITPEESSFNLVVSSYSKGYGDHNIVIKLIDKEGEEGPSDNSMRFGYGYGFIEAFRYDDDINSDVYFINSVVVEIPGYGPLLYDVLMEIVSQEGFALSSGCPIASEAASIWHYYYHKRPDVSKEKILEFEPERFRSRKFYWGKAKLPGPNVFLYKYWKDLDAILRLDNSNKLFFDKTFNLESN